MDKTHSECLTLDVWKNKNQQKLSYNKSGNVCMAKHWGTVGKPSLQWKSNKYYLFWVCICSLTHLACNVQALYCHLWPVPLFKMFPHCLIKGTIFEKVEHKICFDFICKLPLCLKHFLFWKEVREIWLKMCIRLHVKYSLSFENFKILKDFRKILKYKISWKSVQEDPSITMRTDRRTDWR